jgi:transcriptional regulator with XRE-family HTH domain
MAQTFGSEIRSARINKEWSLKHVADRVKKEDGTPISIQYLNDMEHDRRNPPSEDVIRQLAKVLDLSPDYLVFLAGQFPSDIRSGSHSPEAVQHAFQAFRKALRKA